MLTKILKVIFVFLTLVLASFLVTAQSGCCANPGAGIQNFCEDNKNMGVCCSSSLTYGGATGPTSQVDCQDRFFSTGICNAFQMCSPAGCCCDPFSSVIEKAKCKENNFFTSSEMPGQTCQEKCNSLPPGSGGGGTGTACTPQDSTQCGQTDVGPCQYGTRACNNGIWSACQNEIKPTAETCGNNIDEDCNGADLACPSGGGGGGTGGSCTASESPRSCGSDIGICKKGTQTCNSGTWGPCTGDIKPGTEICGNQIDEDCSGVDLECAGANCKGEPFSITKDKVSCETPTGCFYDKSSTPVNDCYTCNNKMECYDYKSQQACVETNLLTNPIQTDACGVGSCLWKPIYAEGGYGVCISKVKDLCRWCEKKGTWGPPNNFPNPLPAGQQGYVVESYEAHNEVYDACTAARKTAMTYGFFDCTSTSVAGSCTPQATQQCGSTNLGVCKYGEKTCSSSQTWGDCENEIEPAGSDTCGDNLDNDCDGSRDEGCGGGGGGGGCSAGQTQVCGSNIGACRRGTETCSGGTWGTCQGGVTAVTEVCGDNIDNNCDNAVDEGCPCSGQPRDCGEDTGECETGTQTCQSGIWGPCVGEVEETDETCNGLDDDCDGTADNNVAGGCAACSGAAINVNVPTNPRAGTAQTFEATSPYNYGSPSLALGNGGQVNSGPTAFSPTTGFGWRWQTTVTSVPGSYLAVATGTKSGQSCAGQRNYNVVANPIPCGSGSACAGCDVQSCLAQGCNLCTGNVCQSGSCSSNPPSCTDADSDGFGTASSSGCPNTGTDCNDNNAAIKPGATEVCSDTDDNDCDGLTNEGCPCTAGSTRVCGSNIGECNYGTQTCTSGIWGTTCTGETGPTAESCDNKDNDCDGVIDEGCACSVSSRPCGTDIGDCTQGTQACVNGQWANSCSGVAPVPETCDTRDNNCDGATDEGCSCTPTGSNRQCGTNVGVCLFGNQVCSSSGFWGICTGGRQPGSEICGNSVDEDCSGSDLLCSSGSCTDLDGDGYGTGCANGPDCNDNNANVHPFAPEICGNGVNEDCSNGDLTCPPGTCTDVDRDTYGSGIGCTGADCDDNNPAIHPGAQETCGNSVDEDCASGDLQCPPSTCTDADRDTYGSGTGCAGPDCNDNNVNVHPGATDNCGDGVDEDCSGTDPTCGGNCPDNDRDGFGTAGTTGCTNTGVDCNDNNPAIKPGAVDICGNNVDEDCTGGDKTSDWHCNQWSECINDQKTCVGGWTDRNNCAGATQPSNTPVSCQSEPGPGTNCVRVDVDAPQNNIGGASVTFDASSTHDYGNNPSLSLGTGGLVTSSPAKSINSGLFRWRWQATVTTTPGNSYVAQFSGTKDSQTCTGSSGFNVLAAPGSCGTSNCNACTSQSACVSGCNWCSGNICQLQSCGSTPPPSSCPDVDGDGHGIAGTTGCRNSGIDCDDNDATIKPMTSETLCDGKDNNCDGQIDNVAAGCPLIITMTKPFNGASNITPFDVEITTDKNSICKYKQNPVSFNAMFPFPVFVGNKTFSQPNYVISASPGTPEPFYVTCRNSENKGVELTRQFELVYDTTHPKITKAEILPEIVADYPLLARMSITTDEKTFCKYGSGKEYHELEYSLSKFTEDNASSYTTFSSEEIIGLVDNTMYNYNVSCKNLVGLTSEIAQLSVLVNTSTPPVLTIMSPQNNAKLGNTKVIINARTNKKAICYYGNTTEPTDKSGTFGLGEEVTHISEPLDFVQGEHTVYVKCSFATVQGVLFRSANVKFTIDLTPPSKPAIDDSSGFTDPEKTPRKDLLAARFKSSDPESEIAFYNYTLFYKKGIEQISLVNWTTISDESVNVRNLNLSDGTTYFFKAKAINTAGLQSTENESNGITVDATSIPSTCANNRTDGNETGVDCGGLCSGCGPGGTCNATRDCAGNLFCNASRQCSFATCNDNIKNQDETDIDCGGDFCQQCGDNKECDGNADCISGICGTNGKCDSAGTCSNGKQDADEADVDCGLKCADNYNLKCAGGKKCKSNLDCKAGKCNFGICGYPGDKDNDNISDTLDNCPETYNPKQEDADKDEKGDACDDDKDNDGMLDQCEIQYLGGTDCTELSRCGPEADPDEDGLLNKEECAAAPFTDPTKEDSDGDGYSDKEEIEKGTDPLDPNSHPSGFSFFKLLLWILLLIILILGGFYGYKYYKKRKEATLPPQQPFGTPPLRMPKPMGPVKQLPRAPLKQQIMLKKQRTELEKKEREKLFEAFGTEKSSKTSEKESEKELKESKIDLPAPEKPDIPTIVPVKEPPLYPERSDVYKKIAEITKQKPEKPFKDLKRKPNAKQKGRS